MPKTIQTIDSGADPSRSSFNAERAALNIGRSSSPIRGIRGSSPVLTTDCPDSTENGSENATARRSSAFMRKPKRALASHSHSHSHSSVDCRGLSEKHASAPEFRIHAEAKASFSEPLDLTQRRNLSIDSTDKVRDKVRDKGCAHFFALFAPFGGPFLNLVPFRRSSRGRLNPEPLNPEPLNPEPLNPEPLNFVIANSKDPRYKRSVPMYRALGDIQVGIDILVYTPEEVEDWSTVPEAIVSRACNEGEVLYEKSA